MVKKKKKDKSEDNLKVITTKEILGETNKLRLKELKRMNEKIRKEKLFFK